MHIDRVAEILQQLGLVEAPLRERSLEDKDPDSLTLEETRELIRRQKEVIQQQEVLEPSSNCILKLTLALGY